MEFAEEHTLDAKSPSYRLPENQLGIGTVTQGPWPGEFQNGHDGFHASACAPPPMVLYRPVSAGPCSRVVRKDRRDVLN